MEHNISNLIDTEKTQRLLDSFCDAVGIAAAVIDLEGEVLVGSRWQKICTDFHRMNESTRAKCIESDTELANELQRGKQFSIYKCRNGLTDAASPIIIEGAHIANAFVGQFLLEPPDVDFFRQQAATYGFDEADYLDGLSLVPIVRGENLPAILNFLTTFAEMVAGMGMDRLRQINATEAFQESEEKYRRLIENATDAIFIAQDEVLRFANRKAEEMTGYSAEELARIPFVDLIHPEDRNMVLERHLKRLRGEALPNMYSFRVLNRYGEEMSVELNVVTIDWEGRPATLNFLRDITKQKRLEVQLHRAQKMEAVGTLAGGIAHDFNNLLMAIQGRASIMGVAKDSSHPDMEHLKEIERHVASAANLTGQLLGFARGGKYEVRPTDLNDLIKNQNRMFGRTKKEIVIHETYEENLWSVEVDRGQIEQVLLNLYVNAWQAMPGGGDLYVKTENVMLDAIYVRAFSSEPGPYVKMSVTDTGLGMDKSTQERIFDPFFTTKGTGRGTGLGLASAYGIIRNHGGFINVYSEKDKGTAFTIYLPASEKDVLKKVSAVDDPHDIHYGRGMVLLVDDEHIVVEVTEQMLENLGYRVLVAQTGKEALEVYAERKEEIDLVILDMIMPGMGGGETFDGLKAIDGEVKVLLSSGYSIDGQATKILERGCIGFIQKPFSISDLSVKVREGIERAW